ncbi:MAG: TPM domain-containing protein [Acidobacteria bacterium]|nr:TPM domain-containing protein [Acidobacteriota bacterium]
MREDEEERVLAAMREFERRTSGEIRVHLAARITRDIMEEARTAFEKLGMTATAERNGVLFFVAVAERRFAVLGDRGIHAQVAPDFWDGVAAAVAERFARGRFADGLCEGIALAGESLAALFPRRPDDRNELPDRISREGDVP